jgi:hypothetical protein
MFLSVSCPVSSFGCCVGLLRPVCHRCLAAIHFHPQMTLILLDFSPRCILVFATRQNPKPATNNANKHEKFALFVAKKVSEKILSGRESWFCFEKQSQPLYTETEREILHRQDENK